MKNYTSIKKISGKLIAIGSLLSLFSATASAQLAPLGASYFQDQYLSNPAFAGLGKNVKINLNYRNQWNSIPGAPVNYALTGEYTLPNEKTTFALNAFSDKAGLLQRTRVVGTFAYHLPLGSNGQRLNFGLSVGFANDHIDASILNGDGGDTQVGNFNDKPTYVDGDFGIGYTSTQWNLQLAVPNLNSFLNRAKRNTSDVGTFYGSAGYKIFGNESDHGFDVEPKVAYRVIRGYKDIADIGANLTVGLNASKINAMLLYHTSENFSAGIGMLFKSKYEINTIFNSQTSSLNSTTNSMMEVGLGIRF